MGMDANILCIGSFRENIVNCLNYPEFEKLDRKIRMQKQLKRFHAAERRQNNGK